MKLYKHINQEADVTPVETSIIHTTGNLLRNLYSSYAEENDIPFSYHVKKDDHDMENGEYGYFINPNVLCLYKFIKKNNIESMIDFGCGCGILLLILRTLNHSIRLGGIDNEPAYIKASKFFLYSSYNIDTKFGDICNVSNEELKRYQMVYFYEPFVSGTEKAKILAEKMVNNLIINAPKGMIINHLQAGSTIFEEFKKQKKYFDIFKNESLYSQNNIYVKK